MEYAIYGDSLFGGMDILMMLMFLLVFTVIIVRLIKNISQWHENNESPVLTVQAAVVTKRNRVTHHHQQNMASSSSTTYYVTFEVESGDRMELRVKGEEYGMLVEGDKGLLTFQGTRYLGFKRN